MDYILTNKEAWEEAIQNRFEGWGEDIPEKINHSYFKKEWVENNGMYYMTKKIMNQKHSQVILIRFQK